MYKKSRVNFMIHCYANFPDNIFRINRAKRITECFCKQTSLRKVNIASKKMTLLKFQ